MTYEFLRQGLAGPFRIKHHNGETAASHSPPGGLGAFHVAAFGPGYVSGGLARRSGGGAEHPTPAKEAAAMCGAKSPACSARQTGASAANTKATSLPPALLAVRTASASAAPNACQIQTSDFESAPSYPSS